MWSYLVPVYLGVAAVLQGGFNRQIAATWGVPATALLNSLVLISVATVTYLVSRMAPDAMPPVMQDHGSFRNFAWHYVWPGVLGYTIVFGLAFAIRELGAAKVFVIMVGAQLLTSIVWDAVAEGIGANWMRVAGAVMAFAGAMMVAFAK